ncbi:MAG TPA: hypothetical protein VFE62_30025, partial [Gemmataceae bacterium]|nr:hypothetical protein [Gemmataceae bacterium]
MQGALAQLLARGALFASLWGLLPANLRVDHGHTLARDSAKERKASAEKWWQDFQKKGDKQVYIEATIKGDGDSARQARRLAAKYPAEALSAITQGARACKDNWIRANLVSTAADLKDPGVTDFLRSELAAPFLYPRVRAAAALASRSDPAGVNALMAEWLGLRNKSTERSDGWAIDELVHGLVRSGSPEAIRSLGSEMIHHDVQVRATIVHNLQSADKDLVGKPLHVDTVIAIEDVLHAAMTDTQHTRSYTLRADGKSIDEPMLGDLAAEALADRWKQANLFDITAPMQVRERQRLAVKNVWLQKRGKRPVEIPAARRILPAAEATMQPLLKSLAAAKSAEDRKESLKAIEAVGLPGLPALKQYLAALKADDPAHPDVSSATTRLALTVAEIRFGSDSAKPTDVVKRAVEARKGKPISQAAFMDMLRGLANDLPTGSRGVRITVERIPDDSGALLEVTLIPDRPARKGLSPQLVYGSKIIS